MTEALVKCGEKGEMGKDAFGLSRRTERFVLIIQRVNQQEESDPLLSENTFPLF